MRVGEMSTPKSGVHAKLDGLSRSMTAALTTTTQVNPLVTAVADSSSTRWD